MTKYFIENLEMKLYTADINIDGDTKSATWFIDQNFMIPVNKLIRENMLM